jgi:iron(III) transport system ATP-binding protein
MVTVTLENVSKLFGDVRAMDRVDLQVEEGEMFFLLGPSGCRKTTTLRVIAGFYKPDIGKIYFDKKSVNDVPPHKRNLGMVFQNYALWPHMTAYENIVYGLKVRSSPVSERVKRAREALEIVKMRDYAERYPNQLSGGQQQRIALARAIVIEPDVLLLDEPLSNLDAKLRIETRNEIIRIQKELGITSIYVTHDQEEALSMGDKIAIMNLGKIEQIDSPRVVYNNPINSFVAGFIGETNFVNGEVISVDSKKSVVIQTDSEEQIFAKNDNEKLKKGDKVKCSIRPEKIIILENDDRFQQFNLFKAEIVRLNYFGLIEHYVLKAFGGLEIKVTNFNPELHKRKENEFVGFTFSPESVDVFIS